MNAVCLAPAGTDPLWKKADVMEPSPRLTGRGLLDETLMAGARVVSGADGLDGPLTWALPFGEVMGRFDDLGAVAVYARPEAIAGNPQALTALAARGAPLRPNLPSVRRR